MPIRNMRSSNHAQRHEAIEVLGEKGHVNNVSILTQYLRNWKTKADLKRAKVKILETLGRLEDDNTIPTIIDMFDDQDVDVKIAAVEALSDFTSLGQNFIQQTFSRYRLVDALQKLFEEVDSVRLRKGIIRVFSNLQIIEVVPFLLELLDHDDPELRADCIAVMGKFADPNIYFYLKDYLNDDHPKIRSNTIIALWQFKQYRLELLMKLTAMIDKNAEIETLVSGIYALGEIESKQEEKLLLSFLENENPIIRIYAAIALAKIEHNHSFSHIVEMIFHDDKNLAQKMKNMIHQIPKNFKKRVMALIHQEVSKRIHEILLEVGHEVEELSELKLEELIELYKLVKFEKEVMKLEKLLSK